MGNSNSQSCDKFLNDKRVIAEIERHLWLESEKAGYDIGYENAKAQWLKDFSATWMKYHMPESCTAAPKDASRKAVAKELKDPKKTSIKRRRAKSYI